MSCHRTRPDQLTLTAWHEAGHALVCAFYYGNVESVTIVPDGNILGKQQARPCAHLTPEYVRFLRNTGYEELSQGLAKHAIQWCLAGRAAESVMLGRAVDWKGTPDFDNANTLARACTPRGVNPLKYYESSLLCEWGNVRRWLKAHRPHLQRVSDVLLARQTISGAEFWDAIEELPPLCFPKCRVAR